MIEERHPRATFVLVTYNQEEFVAEAVQGALEQDYPNLQIIISDDSSSDGTLEVARKRIENFSGDHRILIRRTAQNLGLIPHLYEAARLADGELIIVAAGDDVSYSHRVSELVAAWQRTGAAALCSGWDICDASGAIVSRGQLGGRSDLRFAAFFPGRDFVQIIGATAAYTPAVFDLAPQPPADVFAEDLYFSLMLHYLNRVVSEVPQSLIRYREHAGAMTNTDDRQSVIAHELAVHRESRRVATLLAAVERTICEMEGSPDRQSGSIDLKALQEDIAFNRFRAGWIEAGPMARLTALGRFRDPSHRRWIGLRLFGLETFARIKKLFRGAS